MIGIYTTTFINGLLNTEKAYKSLTERLDKKTSYRNPCIYTKKINKKTQEVAWSWFKYIYIQSQEWSNLRKNIKSRA